MDIGVSLPCADDLMHPNLPTIPDMARCIEVCGLDFVAIADLVLGDGTPSFDPVISAALSAAVTQSVKIFFAVKVIFPGDWFLSTFASDIATLQNCSHNRIILGVGKGGPMHAPLRQVLGRISINKQFQESIHNLKALIAGHPVILSGEEVVFSPAASVPEIFIGGNSLGAIQSARATDSQWFPGSIGLRDLASLIHKYDASDRIIWRSGPVIVGDTAHHKDLREKTINKMVANYKISYEAAAAAVMSGGIQELAEQIQAFADIGVTAVSLTPILAPEDSWEKSVEILGSVKSYLS